MTEAVNTTAMSEEEFEQHHARTWDYIARVGQIWEGIAGEQQSIISGKGYRHFGYASWQTYWDGEFAARSGWKSRAVEDWMHARRIKISTPMPEDRAAGVGPDTWVRLGQIPDPNDRVEFMDHWESEVKPNIRKAESFVSRTDFRQAIKEFKGDPVVRDVLKPEDMADIPSGEFDRFEEWASRTSKLIGPIRRLGASEVADAYERLYPEHMDSEIDWADQIANWYAKYRDELVSRKRAGIHAVN